MTLLVTTVPVKTTNPLNGSHGHWSVRSKARKKQRHSATVYAMANGAMRLSNELPVTILMVRLAPSDGLDTDNLAASLKSVRDVVTDALGLHDDNDPRLSWEYAQERSKSYAVRIEIRRR